MEACATCARSASTMPRLGADRRLLGRKLLGGDGVLGRQSLVAVQIHPGIGQGGAVARQHAFGLGQGGFIGARIDLGQQIAFLHMRADIEEPLLHIAADLGMDGRAGKGLKVARQRQIAAILGDLDLDHLHGGHRLVFGRFRGVAAVP